MNARNTATRRSSGFTLIEVLVCIALIGLLIAILLPAINAARASARKMQCAVRLRELALASMQYEAANKQLPFNRPANGGSKQWQRHLLPHLEKLDLYLAISSEDPYQLSGYEWMTIASFLCPEDPEAEYTMSQWLTGLTVAKSDYVGIAGTTESMADGVFPPYGVIGADDGRYRGIRYSEIIDGLSNTFLFGERPPANNGTVGSWLSGFTYMNATIGVLEQGPFRMGQGDEPMRDCGPQRFHPGNADNPCSGGHNWSYHAGGAHFANVDGAITFRPYSMDENVLREMATRNGQEVISEQ